jgi:hypothetical protein
MPLKRVRQEREKELQSLLATPAGRKELQELVADFPTEGEVVPTRLRVMHGARRGDRVAAFGLSNQKTRLPAQCNRGNLPTPGQKIAIVAREAVTFLTTLGLKRWRRPAFPVCFG